MTNVTVRSGACGFTVSVHAAKGAGRTVSITVDTDCEMVRKMAAELTALDRHAALTGFRSNPVYAAAERHLKHAACPVPSAVLKALEVESGLNVPKDAVIVFETGRKD